MEMSLSEFAGWGVEKGRGAGVVLSDFIAIRSEFPRATLRLLNDVAAVDGEDETLTDSSGSTLTSSVSTVVSSVVDEKLTCHLWENLPDPRNPFHLTFAIPYTGEECISAEILQNDNPVDEKRQWKCIIRMGTQFEATAESMKKELSLEMACFNFGVKLRSAGYAVPALNLSEGLFIHPGAMGIAEKLVVGKFGRVDAETVTTNDSEVMFSLRAGDDIFHGYAEDERNARLIACESAIFKLSNQKLPRIPVFTGKNCSTTGSFSLKKKLYLFPSQ